MNIPFFDLKGKPKVKKDIYKLSVVDTLMNLIELSSTNNKKVKEIVMSDSAREELNPYFYKGTMFGIKIKTYPDVAVIWEKDK